MHKLVALKRLRYPRGGDGVEYEPGERFEVESDRDAKALTLVRAAKVDDKPDEPRSTRQSLRTANMQAEQQSADPAPTAPMTTEDLPPEKTKGYRRRDLKAQE